MESNQFKIETIYLRFYFIMFQHSVSRFNDGKQLSLFYVHDRTELISHTLHINSVNRRCTQLICIKGAVHKKCRVDRFDDFFILFVSLNCFNCI